MPNETLIEMTNEIFHLNHPVAMVLLQASELLLQTDPIPVPAPPSSSQTVFVSTAIGLEDKIGVMVNNEWNNNHNSKRIRHNNHYAISGISTVTCKDRKKTNDGPRKTNDGPKKQMTTQKTNDDPKNK